MAMEASRVDVWAGSIEDRPGGIAEKLSALAEAGAQLEYSMARRSPDKPGEGVVFLTPVQGTGQIEAAKAAGLHKSESLYAVKVEGTDKPGLGAEITTALAEQGINLRGLSASVIGDKFVLWLALDTADDATKAVQTVRNM